MLRIITALALVASITPAIADVPCTDMKTLEAQAKAAKQKVIMTGDLGDGYYLMVFADEKGANFTVIGTRPDGTACRFAGGTNVKVYSPAKPDGKDI